MVLVNLEMLQSYYVLMEEESAGQADQSKVNKHSDILSNWRFRADRGMMNDI